MFETARLQFALEEKMIHSFTEAIRLPEKSKNVGYVLVNTKNADNSDLLNEAIHLFFGSFGTHAVFCSNERYAFCLLVPDNLQKLDIISLYCENGDFAFIEGTFYDRDILVRFKHKNENRIHSAFARWVFNSTVKHGADPLKRINGHYSGFVYISATNRLYCFNDRFGLKKQFVHDSRKCFVVTNNIFTLTANRHLDVTIDEEAVCQILQLDYPLGRRTEFSNISHILPTEVLIREKDAVSYDQIQTLVFDREKRCSIKNGIRDLYDRFDAFIKFLSTHLDEPLGLFLSRGKDSRMFLHFLEKYNDYRLFSFMTKESEWSLVEGEHVEKIAEALSRDLIRLEDFTIDRNIAQMAGMNTTATSSWMALAQLASNHVHYGIIGHGGDVLSGKLEKFRHFNINTTHDYLRQEFKLDCKGVTTNDIYTGFPHLPKRTSIMDQYFAVMENSTSSSVHDFEIEHMIKHRWFRHSVPIQHKAHHYLTPIYPYLENEICDAYCRLPLHLIKSQRAHAVLAAMEKKSGIVPSTEFPITLRTEQYSRPAMMHMIRINNKLNDKILLRRGKKATGAAANSHVIQSSYFKQTIGDHIELGNRQLLHRFKLIDAYLTLALDSNLAAYCNHPNSVEYFGNGAEPPSISKSSPVFQPAADSAP